MGLLSKSDCEPCRACRRVLWAFDKHVLPGHPSGTQIHLAGVVIEAFVYHEALPRFKQPATVISVVTVKHQEQILVPGIEIGKPQRGRIMLSVCLS